jgi:hypothetical protein
LPDFHTALVRAALVNHEDLPIRAAPEERAQRNLQHFLGFPQHDARFHAVIVAERRGGFREIGDDVDALLFDAERRNFGETRRFDQSHLRRQSVVAAPACAENLRARFDFHGVVSTLCLRKPTRTLKTRK